MGTKKSWTYWLLLLPFIALVDPALYARNAPTLGGIPFFFWYQLAWAILVAGLLAITWSATRTNSNGTSR